MLVILMKILGIGILQMYGMFIGGRNFKREL